MSQVQRWNNNRKLLGLIKPDEKDADTEVLQNHTSRKGESSNMFVQKEGGEKVTDDEDNEENRDEDDSQNGADDANKDKRAAQARARREKQRQETPKPKHIGPERNKRRNQKRQRRRAHSSTFNEKPSFSSVCKGHKQPMMML